MEPITLRLITQHNWETCIDLSVSEDQRNFVTDNAVSLVEATYDTEVAWQPRAIYAGEVMVGFVMYGVIPDDPHDGEVWLILRLMIDKAHQGRGYGRAAMESVLAHMRAVGTPTIITTSYEPDNAVAQRLYVSLGFVDVGWTEEGDERLMRMTF